VKYFDLDLYFQNLPAPDVLSTRYPSP